MPKNQFQRVVFAFFTQLFFIQPAVRVIFKALFRKDIEEGNQEQNTGLQRGC